MVFLSFKTDTEIMNAPFAIPDSISFVNYGRALDTLPLLVMYKNTFVIVFFSIVIGVTITFMSSFALARLRFKSETIRSSIYLFILGGLMIPTYVLLFPIYRMNTFFSLIDTYASLFMPLLASSIAFNSLVFVGFLKSFPSEIEEAAVIDGCDLVSLCTRIVAPISTPVFATVIVFNVLYVWNEFPLTVTMIYRPEMYNISLGVSLFRSKYGIDYSGIVAGTVLVVIPQLVFYGLFQRHLVKGLTSGAIKG